MSFCASHQVALPLAAILATAGWGCRARTDDLAPGDYRGMVVQPPGPKPDFTLTSSAGRPFGFRAETDGHLTLLFFGYTHCTDVCPVHMANIAAALRRLGPGVGARLRVVFVTTDPERDTPDRLKTWLANFDSSFIGLTGTPAEIDGALHAAGLPTATRERLPDGTYAIGHAAWVIAYTPDDRERVLYPYGTQPDDWTHDLPRLTRVGAQTP
jgi:protein SCO1